MIEEKEYRKLLDDTFTRVDRAFEGGEAAFVAVDPVPGRKLAGTRGADLRVRRGSGACILERVLEE